MTSHDDVEAKVKKIWRRLTPDLDDTEKKILLSYLERSDAATPYLIAREKGFNVTTVYRKIRRLIDKRLVLPTDDDGEPARLNITVKGCIALYVNNLIDVEELKQCFEKTWNTRLSLKGLLGLLYLLGLEAQKRSLTLRTFTICKMDEASLHVIRFLRNIVARYLHEGLRFEEALREAAQELELPTDYLTEGFRLALIGVSKTIPIIINTEYHKVALFAHGKFLLPVAIECRRGCRHFGLNLGLECPALAKELREYLEHVVK